MQKSALAHICTHLEFICARASRSTLLGDAMLNVPKHYGEFDSLLYRAVQRTDHSAVESLAGHRVYFTHASAQDRQQGASIMSLAGKSSFPVFFVRN